MRGPRSYYVYLTLDSQTEERRRLQTNSGDQWWLNVRRGDKFVARHILTKKTKEKLLHGSHTPQTYSCCSHTPSWGAHAGLQARTSTYCVQWFLRLSHVNHHDCLTYLSVTSWVKVWNVKSHSSCLWVGSSRTTTARCKMGLICLSTNLGIYKVTPLLLLPQEDISTTRRIL